MPSDREWLSCADGRECSTYRPLLDGGELHRYIPNNGWQHLTRLVRCDRCGEPDNVEIFDECPECGPVPLCGGCEKLHRDEIAEARGAV